MLKNLIHRSTLALAAFACVGTFLISNETFAQSPDPQSGPVAGQAGQPGQFPRGRRGGGRHGGLQRKLQQLNLSESQRSQIRDIMQRYQNDRRNPAMKQEIMAVLTPEQRDQLKGMRGGRRGGRRMPPATTNGPTATPKPPSF